MRIAGARVLITGAARGIGKATAGELAGRGARLSLVGLEPDRLARLAERLGPGHLWAEADVRDPAALDRAVRATTAGLGGVDVVVANAGIANLGTVATMDPAGFADVVDVNLIGTFRTVRATLPAVVAARGHILIVASVSALAPGPGMAAYAASKAGLEALANALRGEVAHRGVGVTCAYPSWVDTDLVRGADAEISTFRDIRRRLPWPLRVTTPVEECARALVAGIERGAARVYVPRSAALLHWLRPLVAGAAGDLAVISQGARLVPRLEAEMAAHPGSGGTEAETLQPRNG